MTFFVTGLARPVAIVGDSLFAGSMGGGNVSYEDAVRNNLEKILTLPNETILCPGHGPMTTVAKRKGKSIFCPVARVSPNRGTIWLARRLAAWVTFGMNIGFVGVGRMGANMARRLKDRVFTSRPFTMLTVRPPPTLAQELGSFASQSLGEVTAGADVIITVVSDDAAMRANLCRAGRQPARQRAREALHQLRHHFAGGASGGGGAGATKPARRRSKPAWPRASRRRAKDRFISCAAARSPPSSARNRS